MASQQSSTPTPPEILVHDGRTFVSVSLLSKIPNAPADPPISDRFFNEPLGIPVNGPYIKLFAGQLFVSLDYFNLLLATMPTRKLRASLVVANDEEGASRLSLRLNDQDGNWVPLIKEEEEGGGVASAMDHLDHQRVLSRRDDAQVEVGDEEELCHDNPHEEQWVQPQDPSNLLLRGVDVEQAPEDETEAEVNDDSIQGGREDLQDRHNRMISYVNATVMPEANSLQQDRASPKLTSSEDTDSSVDEALEPLSPEDNNDDDTAPMPPPSRTPRSSIKARDSRALIKQLHELRLSNPATLSDLLNHRMHPALSRFATTQNSIYIHLATLANGTVYALRIYDDLHARREDLGHASLADPSLLQRRLTAYQKFELGRILRSVGSTPHGVQFWTHAQLGLKAIERKLFRLEYCLMGDFRGDVEQMLETSIGQFGEAHELSAACRRTVEDIFEMMERRFAVGELDTEEPMFNGLIREMVIEGDIFVPQKQPPRFVLPLGRLYEVKPGDSVDENPGRLKASILVDLTSPPKGLWLFSRKVHNCQLVMLAEGIEQWKAGSGIDWGGHALDGGLLSQREIANGGGRTQLVPRETLFGEYPESKIELPHGAVRFCRANKKDAADAISRGWAVNRADSSATPPGHVGSWRPPQTTPRRKRRREEGDDGFVERCAAVSR